MRTDVQALAAAALVLPLVGAAAAAPAPVEGETVLVFRDPEIVESSGLVVTSDLAVTVNDSGDSARIFTVDLSTGETVGVTEWDGAARDIEALAPADNRHVWVGDIGDNLAARDSVVVARVPFGPGDQNVVAESYELIWPDGARDAEALLASPVDGQLFVVSKDTFGGQVYAVPRDLDPGAPNRLKPVAEAAGLITDGAFFPDGRHAILRNYGVAYVHELPSWRQVAMFRLPPQQQGEGIAVSPAGEVLLSSEGVESELLRIDLPDAARVALGGEAQEPSPTSRAEPTDRDRDAPRDDDASTDRADPAGRDDWWPWVLGGLVGVLALVVLVRRRPGS